MSPRPWTLLLLATVAMVVPITSFCPMPDSTRPSFTLDAKKQATVEKKPVNTAEFDYQELKVQTQEMIKQNVNSFQLLPEKRTEIENYARRVVAKRKSSSMDDISTQLPDTRWRLAFTTQTLMSQLPQDATIVMEFLDSAKMNYALEFSKKTLGLNRLTAQSTYKVEVSFPFVVVIVEICTSLY